MIKKLLRRLWWRIHVKRILLQWASEQNPLLGYPMIVVIEFEGEVEYIKQSHDEFTTWVLKRLEEVSTSYFAATGHKESKRRLFKGLSLDSLRLARECAELEPIADAHNWEEFMKRTKR